LCVVIFIIGTCVVTVIFIVFTYVIGLTYMGVGRLLSKYIQKNFGWTGFCIFGAIGVPFHELAHLITVVLFLHKIDDVSLFRPKKGKVDGCLGYVKHSYKKTLYRTLGNFFIGAAPMIFGAGALFFLIKLFFPSCFIDILAVTEDGFDIKAILLSSWEAFKTILSLDTLKSPWLYVVFLAMVCIGAHMNMSWPDVKNATAGAIALVVGSVAIPMAITYYTPVQHSQIFSVVLNFSISYAYILLIGLIINLFLTLLFFIIAAVRGRV